MFNKTAITTFAILMFTAVGTSPLLYAQVVSDQPAIAVQTSGTYTFGVGDAQVTALSDGTVPQDLHALLHGTTSENTDALLKRSFLTNPVETSLNAFLVKVNGRVVLVDVGVGQLFGPGYGGRLLESLSAAGVIPDQVTDILLTHLHPDHIGGLVQDGRIVFANATVHVGKPDLDFFLDRTNATKSHYDVKYFDQAIGTMKPYVDAGKVATFQGTAQIIPGVTATVHAGHTPGSAFYTLESQGQKIVFVGDIVHAAAVQFPQPSITIAYDVDLKGAEETRAQTFASVARDRSLIAVPHLPFPGVGHVRATGKAYEWIPVEYASRASK